MEFLRDDYRFLNTLAQEDLPTDVIIGSKTGKFVPNINMSRWDDEAWLNINFPQIVLGERAVLSGGQIVQSIGDFQHKFYVQPDGTLEYEIILGRRPPVNSFTFNLAFPDGLHFAYQSPLTPEQIADGHSRPPRVVGSYAVYWKRANGKYKAGKFCHIYRPDVVDALGRRTWAKLSIDPIAKTLTILVDPTWLANAAYPVIIGPNLGYATLGGTSYDNLYKGMGRTGVLAGSNGTATAMYMGSLTAGYEIKMATYDAWTGGNRLTATLVSTSVTNGWCSASTGISITSGNSYFPSFAMPVGPSTLYDSGGSHGYNTSITYANEMLDPCQTMISDGSYISLYLAYDEAGAAGGPPAGSWMMMGVGV